MKHIVFLFVVCCLVFVQPASAQLAKNAVDADPLHHHVVFENDFVRVFEVLAKPGSQSPMHSHLSSVIISAGKARMNMSTPDGSKSIFDLSPAQVLWIDKAEHSWEVLSGELHVFGVEIKPAINDITPTPVDLGPNDAVAVDPVYHPVLFENEHVRILEVLAGPGSRSPMHTHPPILGISLTKVRFNLGTPDGSRVITDLRPGEVFWFDQAEHEWEVISGLTHTIAVEVKAANHEN